MANLRRSLVRILGRIKDPALREKVKGLIKDPYVVFEGKKLRGLPFEEAPASIGHHQSYPGGLLEHTVAVAELSLALARIVKRIYRCRVNLDHLVAGALLHDLFKVLAYEVKEGGGYRLSPLAERIDHLTLTTSELMRRGFPIEVIHMVAASHGQEHGPIGPRTMEALICHLSDLAESRLNGDILNAAKRIAKEVAGEEVERITGINAFKLVYAKQTGRLEEVRRMVKELKAKSKGA